jgi:hypothetical protein
VPAPACQQASPRKIFATFIMAVVLVMQASYQAPCYSTSPHWMKSDKFCATFGTLGAFMIYLFLCVGGCRKQM